MLVSARRTSCKHGTFALRPSSSWVYVLCVLCVLCVMALFPAIGALAEGTMRSMRSMRWVHHVAMRIVTRNTAVYYVTLDVPLGCVAKIINIP